MGGDNLFANFETLLESRQGKAVLIVAAAHDEFTLEAVFRAVEVFNLDYRLVGDEKSIRQICAKLGKKPDSIIHAANDEEIAKKSVLLVKEATNGVLVKGHIETSTLLKAVVNKESGIRASKTMSHIAFLEIPSYKKLLAVTDGGMCASPNLEQKIDIVNNALNLYYNMAGGDYIPKLAALAASETLNPKLEDSVHADELKKLALRGEFGDVVFEGPISFDLAISKKSAEKKGFASPVCGDVDIFLMPGITAGNVFCKCLIEWAGAKMAGVVVGASAPIVLVSRSASAEEKLNSIALCLK